MNPPRVMCLHQIFRPYPDGYIQTEGHGNCLVCMPHPDNTRCVGYCPVGLIYADMKVAEFDGNKCFGYNAIKKEATK